MALTADIHARVPTDLIKTLDLAAKITETTKSSIIYKAVEKYLAEIMEDYEDAQIASQRLADPNQELCSWEEIESMLKKDKK